MTYVEDNFHQSVTKTELHDNLTARLEPRTSVLEQLLLTSLLKIYEVAE